MVIPLIVMFFLSCQAATAQLRDDSGLLNIFELSSLVDGVCEQELRIHKLLSNPLFSIILKPILRFHIPFLPGPDKSKPLYYLEWVEDHLGNLEDRLSDYLEGKPFVMEESYVQHPNHTSYELGDLLLSADFLCKTTHLWYDIVSTKLSDLLGLWHIRLPIIDFKHKFELQKALDFLDLLGIPDRIHRLLTGHLGLSTTTTTTHKPTFLESLFNQGAKTTTPKPKQPGFFESLFGSHTTTTTTTATTTTTKPGLFASLFGSHPASTGKPASTTKGPGGFLASLFGHTDPTTIKRPFTLITHKTTTKKPGGLFGGLFGERRNGTSTTPTEIEEGTKEDYNDTVSDELEASSSKKPSGILSGLLHVKHSTSTVVPNIDESSEPDDLEATSSKKPSGILSGLLHVKHSTPTVVPNIDESSEPDDLEATSSTKSSGILSGLLHVKKQSTSTVVPNIDEPTSEKKTGFFRKKHSTVADFSESTIGTKKFGGHNLFGSKNLAKTSTISVTLKTSTVNPESDTKVDDTNIPNEIDSTPLSSSLYTFDSKETIHQIIEEIGEMDKRSL